MTNTAEDLVSAADFKAVVPQYGYRWWYIDAFSDDYQYGLTIIAFIGSVFSPYYAWSRARGHGDPYNHCALNVSLYGKGGKRWTMTERTQKALIQSTNRLCIEPSSLELSNGQLVININEWTFPVPGKLKGQINVMPHTLVKTPIKIDQHGHHYWQPIAPMCKVSVTFDKPERKWQGHGYFDTNWGSEPLEAGFKNWDWSRADLPGGRSAILYDVIQRNGERLSLALSINRNGNVERFKASGSQALNRSLWRIERRTQSDDNYRPTIIYTLEDAPFYARSMINTSILGSQVTAMHESLDLDRFSSKWVQVLLPFKMPRYGSL